jgi:hypothetical protein
VKLTDENKAKIDAMSYEGLLSKWRFAPAGDPWFQGETGDYWSKRMAELRSKPGGQDEHVRSSKSIGWERER